MSSFEIRDALKSDNRGLIDLAMACPMQGDVGLCVDRSPDFFQLNRLEGHRWKVNVAERGGEIIGCVGAAERRVYLNGRPTQAIYAGDLKVHPAHRDHSVADALMGAAVAGCETIAGPDVPTYATILAGNAPAERLVSGQRGLPKFDRIATINSASVGLLWKRSPGGPDLEVREARADDLEEMLGLWQRVAPERQLAPAHDLESFRRWIEDSPGLGYSSYRLAFDRSGHLAGFAGFWDQDCFKHMRVMQYSRRLTAFRFFYNLFAPLIGAVKLPPPGGVLRYLTVVNPCVPSSRPDVLRAILLAAYNELRGRDYAFITIGLDVKDPLTAALKGLMTQPMLVNGYISSPSGAYRGPALDQRPLHFEIALV
jgi:GNAT acetyltransferase-like protein